MIKVQNRLEELIAIHSRKTGERLTQSKLSEETGIARSTLSRYIKQETNYYDLSVIERLIDFFGLTSLDELFVIEDDSTGNNIPSENAA